jgi:hypothetical protein
MRKNNVRILHTCLIFVVISCLALSSCKKKNEEPDTAMTPLMILNFTDNYINPKLGAIIFASDPAGKVIADTTFKGNGKVMLYAKPGIAIPPRFTLTIATWEPSMHNFEINIKSYQQVETSEWTMKGHRPDTLGHFTLNLSNVTQAALVLYANSGHSNLTTITDNVVNMSYTDPDELLVTFGSDGEQVYKWITGVHPGGVYNIDMSGAVAPELTSISLSGIYCEARTWGYRNSAYEDPLPMMTNFSLGNVPAGNKLKVAVYPGHFQGYHTELEIIESWDSATSYIYRVNGDIPSSFVRVNARVLSMKTFPAGRVEIKPDGDYTMTSVLWQFSGTSDQIFNWTLFGDDTTTAFNLPEIPPSMRQMFPTLALESSFFIHAEVTKYPGIASYDSFIHTLFDPSNPRSQNKLDASILIYRQAK